MPPPVLEIFKVWDGGLLPPYFPVKERLVGLTPMAGGKDEPAVIVNVTGTATDEAPVALTAIVPW
jgi:hypothetical protein